MPEEPAKGGSIMASTNRPPPAARRSQSSLRRAQRNAAELSIQLRRLDGADRPDLFFPIDFAHDPEVPVAGRYTRLHGLGDADALLAALAELERLRRRQPSESEAAPQASKTFEVTPPVPSEAEVHNAAFAQRPRIVMMCTKAGMGSDKAISACHGVLRAVAPKFHALGCRRFGKERQREFASIVATAKDLLATVPLLRRWALTDARARRSALIRRKVECLLATLENALPRVIHNATRQRDEVELGMPGGAPVPDPVTFGAECMLSIWHHHHPDTPTLSRNNGGFLMFGKDLLDLALEVQGAGRPARIGRTTLETALRQQVTLARRSKATQPTESNI